MYNVYVHGIHLHPYFIEYAMRRDTAAPHFERVPFGESVRWRLTALCELQFGGSCFEEFVLCLVLCWFFADLGDSRNE